MPLSAWCDRWGVSPAALDELRLLLCPEPPLHPGNTPEGVIQADVRLEASQKGVRIFRNNRGAFQDATGRWIRYGLANDSKQYGDKIKSSDLIGIRKVTVTPDMVGGIIGQFVSREIKRAEWKYRGTAEERAQLAWLEFVLLMGGDAAFANSTGTL